MKRKQLRLGEQPPLRPFDFSAAYQSACREWGDFWYRADEARGIFPPEPEVYCQWPRTCPFVMDCGCALTPELRLHLRALTFALVFGHEPGPVRPDAGLPEA